MLLRNVNCAFDAAVKLLQVIHLEIAEGVVIPMPLENFGVSVAMFKALLEFFRAHAENLCLPHEHGAKNFQAGIELLTVADVVLGAHEKFCLRRKKNLPNKVDKVSFLPQVKDTLRGGRKNIIVRFRGDIF